jgi:hypothetical protein
MAVLFNLKKGNIMFMISDKQQLKEVQHKKEEKRVARIQSVLKFLCLFALCILILAPWLEALFIEIKR